MTSRSRTPDQRHAIGRSLAGTLILACIALGMGLLASASSLRLFRNDAVAAETRIAEPPPRRPQGALIPGFQQRGNSLVGDVRNADGTLMRLVFDARSQTLIGMKIIAQADRGESLQSSREECLVQGVAAPKPPSLQQ